jgi:hypothetical protein
MRTSRERASRAAPGNDGTTLGSCGKSGMSRGILPIASSVDVRRNPERAHALRNFAEAAGGDA